MVRKPPAWVGISAGILLLIILKSGQRPSGVHGLAIVDKKIVLIDWQAWMKWAPKAVADARLDGAETGEQIASSLFRRLFPDRQWPPLASDPIVETWRKITFDIQNLVPALEEEEREFDDKVIPIRGA